MICPTYVGTELELFAAAQNWKSYVALLVAPYLGREVLEVGAGLGGTTRTLCRGDHARWVCLEPDATLASQIERQIAARELPSCCEVAVETLESAAVSGRTFDTLLYMDVLEHIADDRAELQRAVACLKSDGHLIVLSPAHPFLYTPFDAAIGHHRRYTRASLRALTPDGAELERLDYLDSVGLLASLANRLVLRSAMPTPRQIAFWDNVLVRASRFLDPLTAYRVGKSVLGVWRKAEPNG